MIGKLIGFFVTFTVPESGAPHDNGRFVPQNDLQGDEQVIMFNLITLQILQISRIYVCI